MWLLGPRVGDPCFKNLQCKQHSLYTLTDLCLCYYRGTQYLKLQCNPNLVVLKNIFPQLQSFQVTAHRDIFPPFKIFFTSVSKFTAPHCNLNVDFNVIYCIFWSQCITGRNTLSSTFITLFLVPSFPQNNLF